jgi:hypothetical protein
MKTSIYCKNEENTKFILTKLLNIIEDNFNRNLLSIPTNGTNLPILSKRTQPLEKMGLNDVNYNKIFKVKFYHTNLVVSGLKHIISVQENI